MTRPRPVLTRRRFLGQAGAAAGAMALPTVVPASVLGRHAPSGRIHVACIGVGNQGEYVMRQFLKQPDVQVVAVCDVNRASRGYRDETQFLGRDPAREAVNAHYAARAGVAGYAACDAYVDFREALERSDVDAVTVVTPDHWHAAITIAACQAGKDVYCEKPLSLTVADGRAMVRAVARHGRVLQTGSHHRSNAVNRRACELVRNGYLGTLRTITTFVPPHNKVGPGPGWRPRPVPEGFDYARWLGPAPRAPYHPDRCHYRFRFIYAYSGGQVTNFGAHSNDLAQWAMGTDRSGPTEVELVRAEFLPCGSLFDAATVTEFRCRYPSGVELRCVTDPRASGLRFEGSEGVIALDYGRMTTEPAALASAQLKPSDTPLPVSADHVRDFLDCVRSRREPIAPAEVGHRSASLCHIGNIAVRLGRHGPLLWDPAAERFTNHPPANRMLRRRERCEWEGRG